jgi:hypothetical protein
MWKQPKSPLGAAPADQPLTAQALRFVSSNHPFNRDHRFRPPLPFTAMPIARFCPTTTRSRFARVIPV